MVLHIREIKKISLYIGILALIVCIAVFLMGAVLSRFDRNLILIFSIPVILTTWTTRVFNRKMISKILLVALSSISMLSSWIPFCVVFALQFAPAADDPFNYFVCLCGLLMFIGAICGFFTAFTNRDAISTPQ